MFGRWRKAAKVRQNLVENSIGVVSGERGNSLVGTVAEAGNTIIVIYSQNQNIGEAAGQKNNLQATRARSPPWHVGVFLN